MPSELLDTYGAASLLIRSHPRADRPTLKSSLQAAKIG
jgi:hypothetical protein